jgi:hypothetical protein
MHIFTDCSRVAQLEEVGIEQGFGCVLLQHLQKARERVAHVVVVSEDLPSISSPHFVPHVLRVHAYAVDEPLGVVVQGKLKWSVKWPRILQWQTYIDLERATLSSSSDDSIQHCYHTRCARAKV